MKNAFVAIAVIGWIWTVVIWLWIALKLRTRREIKRDSSNESSSS
jgi:hypothetical protein